MKGSVAVVKLLSVVCFLLVAQGQALFAQEKGSASPTKTIVGDLLDVDRDFYIVRGERGEIQIEATHKTEITEEFGYGDRIRALVLMNNKAVKIERAGPDDVSGVTENVPVAAPAPVSPSDGKGEAPAAPSPQPQQPESKTIVGDLLDVDRDFYIVRGERGEIQIEATHKTEITEEFGYGDRIRALVLMNNKAVKIERAGPDDVSGVTENVPVAAPAPAPPSDGKGEAPAAPQPQQPESKTIVGDLLDVDRDFYIVRGERGEIQIEATHKTEITEEFGYGDRIKAKVLMNNKAVKIERAGPDDVTGVHTE